MRIKIPLNRSNEYFSESDLNTLWLLEQAILRSFQKGNPLSFSLTSIVDKTNKSTHRVVQGEGHMDPAVVRAFIKREETLIDLVCRAECIIRRSKVNNEEFVLSSLVDWLHSSEGRVESQFLLLLCSVCRPTISKNPAEIGLDTLQRYIYEVYGIDKLATSSEISATSPGTKEIPVAILTRSHDCDRAKT